MEEPLAAETMDGGTQRGGGRGWEGGREEQITVVNWAPNDSAAAPPDAGRRVSN